jgi:hemoglobin
MAEASLYERLGGAFAIAAVIDHFSDAVVANPLTGQGSPNAQLNEWSTDELGRLPGLKFMRTLWVCDIAGAPQGYAATKPGSTQLGLEEAHRALKISAETFDQVGAETRAIAWSLQRARAGEGGGPGGVCRAQGRGERGILPVAPPEITNWEDGYLPLRRRLEKEILTPARC